MYIVTLHCLVWCENVPGNDPKMMRGVYVRMYVCDCFKNVPQPLNPPGIRVNSSPSLGAGSIILSIGRGCELGLTGVIH